MTAAVDDWLDGLPSGMPPPGDPLDPYQVADATEQRMNELDTATARAWGGRVMAHGVRGPMRAVRPQSLDLDTDYSEPTIVRSAADGLDAFEKYTEFFDHVLEQHDPDHDAAVLLPCGKNKPIGTSQIHSKKLDALDEAGYTDRCDIHIISEPCTIIPHERRLSLPAVNYDFPPEYTEPDEAPDVFEVFTDRLARWVDATDYDTLYPYLVQGHQEKFDAAMEKADRKPRVVRIPGASYNMETGKYSGDLFKSVDDVATKLDFVRGLKDRGDESYVASYPDDAVAFYSGHDDYQQVA